MSKRLSGTLLGIVFSFAAIALWVVLEVYLGIIAGIAGALIGVLFLLGYKKLNRDDKSKYVYVAASILIIIEIIAAEFLAILLLAITEGVEFLAAIADSEIQSIMIWDIVVGFVLSFGVFIAYVFAINRRNKQNPHRVSAPLNGQSNEQPQEIKSEQVFAEFESAPKSEDNEDNKPN